jgi:C-terminal processing protease CtpA/Prc
MGNDEINDFVWQGMNSFYLWQKEVPDLNDRFTTFQQIWDFYADFNSPRDVFNSLLYQPGTVDRFSWIVDDYVALENSFQGINVSNGMEFGLVRFATNTSNVFGYVRYVIPGSDAELQGITRGMLFTEVDGTQITDSNFNGLLFGDNTSYTISLANYNDGDPVVNGNSITLNKTQLQENPIHLTTTITEGSNKIGYLMYNQFTSSFNNQLNAAFATFQGEAITDLIIDLRYNGGGSAATARYLASMITGQFAGQVFSKSVYNDKLQPNLSDAFLNKRFTNAFDEGGAINSLSLNRVYFITTGSSASASELVMNSLAPYIDVNSVGTTTLGKVHGSITIYDSDDFLRDGANLNQDHTWALQPLVVEIQNSNDFNQPNGITPTVELREDYDNLGVLGDRSDPLLDRTIILITTGNRAQQRSSAQMLDEISNSQINKPFRNNMLVNLKGGQ